MAAGAVEPIYKRSPSVSSMISYSDTTLLCFKRWQGPREALSAHASGGGGAVPS